MQLKVSTEPSPDSLQ